MHDNFFKAFDKFKIPIALTLIGLVLIIGGVFASGLNKSKNEEFPKESLVRTPKVITVDVSGAVNSPGVYHLKEGDRIENAVNAAEGFSEDSNKEYISKYINLAQKLVDGTKIYIPAEGEQVLDLTKTSVSGVSASSDQININNGSQTELEALPGIGAVTASKIIAQRPYQSIDELLAKKVVSKAVYEKIKDLVVLY